MKKFKKILTCAAACATACSFAALTACTNDETPSDKLTADVTVAEAMSAEELATQIARFENASSTSSFTLEGSLKAVKLLGGPLPDGIYVAEVAAKGNLEDGDADILLNLNKGLFESGASTAAEGETTEGGDTANDQMVEMNVFLRGWKAFATSEPYAETYDYVDLAELLGGADSAAGGMTSWSEYVFSALGAAGSDASQLLKLANTTDSIVVDETAHTVSFNINKMVYGLYGYIKQIVDNLTVNTSLSGLMQCSAVKYYIETFTEGMTAQQLYDTVMEIIGNISGGGNGETTPYAAAEGGAESNPLAALLPLQNEKVYDYIVRLLNSQDVAALLGSQKPLGATTVGEILGQDGAAALNSLKQVIGSLDGTVLSEHTLTIPATDPTVSEVDTKITDFTVVYTFSEQDVLQSVGVSGTIVADMEGECEMELSLEVTLLEEKVTEFTDISDYVVNIYDENGVLTGTTTAGEILNAPTV